MDRVYLVIYPHKIKSKDTFELNTREKNAGFLCINVMFLFFSHFIRKGFKNKKTNKYVHICYFGTFYNNRVFKNLYLSSVQYSVFDMRADGKKKVIVKKVGTDATRDDF